MTRNYQSLVWVAVVVGVWALFTQLLPVHSPPPQALLLSPNPWIGLAGALIVTAIAAFPAWRLLRRSRGLQHTDQGLVWEPSGVEAARRVLVTAALAYGAGTLTWLWLAPSVVVDLAPFVSGLLGPLQATCDATRGVPPDVMWAIDGMCLWNQQRVLPFGVGAAVIGLFSLVIGAFVVDRTEVLKLELDSRGIHLTTETGTERTPWSGVESAEHIGTDLVVSLRDGTRLAIHARGLSAEELTGLLLAIDRHKRGPERLTAAEKARLQQLERLGE